MFRVWLQLFLHGCACPGTAYYYHAPSSKPYPPARRCTVAPLAGLPPRMSDLLDPRWGPPGTDRKAGNQNAYGLAVHVLYISEQAPFASCLVQDDDGSL